MFKKAFCGFAAATAAAVFATAAFAADPPLQVSYPTDGALSCEGLAAEAVRMDGIIATATDSTNKANGSGRAAGLAGTIAVEAGARSGVFGRMPGLGFAANAMSGAAQKGAQNEAAKQAEIIQTANTRKTVVLALYSGKNCGAAAPGPAGVTQASQPVN